MQRIREPVTHKNFAFVRDHPTRKHSNSNNYKQGLTDEEYQAHNDLLDQFSAGHNLEDHLSHHRHMGKSRSRPNNLDFAKINTYNDHSYHSSPPSRRALPDPYPYNPPQFNPQPQPQFNPYPYPQPTYGFNPQLYPSPQGCSHGHCHNHSQSESPDLKLYMQKQNDLLESMYRRMNTRERTAKSRKGLDSRAIDNKFKDYEKETELRLQLMKQQQIIESLQNQSPPQQLQRNQSDGSNPNRKHFLC